MSVEQYDLKHSNSLEDIVKLCPKNQTIIDSVIKAYHKINNNVYDKIVCTVSGGADSDVMMDVCHKCDNDNKVDYVWFDTGLEYQATKDHLEHLKEKYNIDIKRYKACKSVPVCCREYGQPFLSKNVSQNIMSLQRYGFKFEDKPYEELCVEYPQIKSKLKWWCNMYDCDSFNIKNNKWLKEFMVVNPPTFNISHYCCRYAKKNVISKLLKENEYKLNISGVRKSEGGARARAYKSCFDDNGDECDNYRPLFWYNDNDRKDYEEQLNIVHSKCYTEYGLKRTGCAGCPFGREFEQELKIIEKHEPKLFKVVNKIFGDSYGYTRKYKSFCNDMDKEYGSYASYLRNRNN